MRPGLARAKPRLATRSTRICYAISRSPANHVWALDATYIHMARGFLYLTAIVDVASRKVTAHKVAITLEAVHAKEVTDQAFARYGVPESNWPARAA